MSAVPIITETKIYIPRAISRRTCYANEYIIVLEKRSVMLKEKQRIRKFSATKKPQVIDKTPEMRYLVHVYTTTRGNVYITVYDLLENKQIVEVSTLMPLKSILSKISQLPEYVKKIVSDELFY